MDRLLARLERRIGRYAIPNLIVFVVAGMALIWVLSLSRPWATERLVLDMEAVRRGQPWRLVTFLFVPIGTRYWVLLALYFTWWVGSNLEQHWGAFRFNVYYFLGALGAIAGALVSGNASNTWLDASLLLAFATLFPDVTIMLFFVVPVRVKWLGLFSALLIAVALVRGDWEGRAALAASLANYVVFFAGHWVGVWRQRGLGIRQKTRRAELRPSTPLFGQRSCALCGARESEGADIRVCSCEKCGSKPRALCLEHARKH